MVSKVSEILYHRYRKVFDKEKTAKAFGYWKPSAHAESFFRLVKRATQEDLEMGKVYSALLHAIGASKKNQYEQLFHMVSACSVYCVSRAEFDIRYKMLCTEIRNSDIFLLNDSSIELLICILSTLGLFKAALLLREKYEAKVLAVGSALQKYSVYFQNGRFQDAYELLQEASYFRFFKILHPRTYSSMERSLLPAIHPEVAEARSSFAKYLQGKAIYIIGPSDNKTPIPIDAKNRVVIRYAYMGRDKVGGYYKTIPTDVSYYNGMHATTVASMDKPKFLSDLSFAVLKYKLQTPFWDNVSELLQVRYANRTPYTLQHGVSPNMLQIVLMDLLPFGKLNLTVLDNNLYLNRNYTEGYASNQVQKKMDDFAFANQFAKHDVFCNFKFTRALFKQGFFVADSRLEDILNMSCEQFAKAMECEYGHKQDL